MRVEMTEKDNEYSTIQNASTKSSNDNNSCVNSQRIGLANSLIDGIKDKSYGNKYDIRRATLEDKSRMNELASQVFYEHDLIGFKIQFKNFIQTYDSNRSQLSWTPDEVLEKAALLTQDMYVIKKEKEIIGFSGIEIPAYEGDIKQIGWLNWTAIDPEYQGNGLGKALLEYIMGEVKTYGIKSFGIKTTPQHYPHAGKLYNKAGFKLSGKLNNYYGKGLDCDIYFADMHDSEQK